jgi:hypothetical protein
MFLIAEELWDVVTGDDFKVKKSKKAKTKMYLIVDKTLSRDKEFKICKGNKEQA